MIFIRPKILRDAAQAAIETDPKYNYMREEQRKDRQMRREAVPLLPGVTRESCRRCRRADRRPPQRPPGARHRTSQGRR